MAMVTVIGDKPVKYGGEFYNKGDQFDCADKFVRALTALGKIESAGAQKPSKSKKKEEKTPEKSEEIQAEAENVSESEENSEESEEKAQPASDSTYSTKVMKTGD